MKEAVSRLARRCARALNPRPVVRQYDRVDCGPACLLSVLRFHGGDTGLPTVRSWSGTDANGTSLLGLQRAAARLGFQARGATGDYEDLRKEQMPCIAHLVHEGVEHYVVVYEVRHRRVRIGDPGRGLLWLQREEFERLWVQQAVLLLNPTGDLIREDPPHWFGWVLGRIRHVHAWLVQSVFLGVIYTVLGLATAVLVQRLIDDYIGGDDAVRILWAGGVLLAIHTGKGLIGFARQRFLVGLGKWTSTAIASEFLEHLFRLPASYFDTRKRGDIIARLQDASHVQTAVLDIVGSTTIDLLITTFSLAAVFYFSPPLGWIAVVLILPCALLARMTAQRIHQEQDATLGAYGLLHASYVDAVDGIDAIRGLGAGRVFASLNLLLFGRFQDRVERLGFTRAKIGVQVETVNGAMLATILTAGALLVASGDLKIGAMMAAYSLVAGALPSLQGVIGSLFAFQGGAAAAQRLQDLLLTEPELSQGSNPFKMDACLSLENARFEWPNGGPVLMGANLTLQRGRTIGLTGSNGSGKTTLVHVLSRAYPLTHGRLSVDQSDASSIGIRSYRLAVGIVPETVKIFHGTLGENLALGLGEVTVEELETRLDSLAVREFTSRFKDGLATLLGEDGRRLSAGERQMTGLIRALITGPSVLIIDEGLNALDPRMHGIAMRALAKHAETGATLLISHHPSVLAVADERLLLKGGVIIPATDDEAEAEAGAQARGEAA